MFPMLMSELKLADSPDRSLEWAKLETKAL